MLAKALLILALLTAAPTPPPPLATCRTLAVRQHLGAPLVRVDERGQCQWLARSLDGHSGLWLPLR